MYEWNEDGPVYGPNGQLELDPDNYQCRYVRPVFSTCKNNCPGGELSVFHFKLKIEKLNKFPPLTSYCEILIIVFSVNFPVVAGEAV